MGKESPDTIRLLAINRLQILSSVATLKKFAKLAGKHVRCPFFVSSC